MAIVRVIFLGGGQEPDIIGNVTEETAERVRVETAVDSYTFTPQGLHDLAMHGEVRLIRSSRE